MSQLTDTQRTQNLETMKETRAYRKGFHQGLCQAINAFNAGLTPEQANAWEQLVKKWKEKPPFYSPAPECPGLKGASE